MGSFNQNVLPSTAGLSLGSIVQPWNIFAQNLVASNLSTNLGSIGGSITISPTGIITLVQMTLAGSVSLTTFDGSGLAAGSLVAFKITQDGTGGWAYSWPSQAIGMSAVGTDPNQSTYQLFIWDGTNLLALSPGIFNP